MQVFGLPGHVIGNGRVASRLIGAGAANIEAALRRDAVASWRQAMADGLSSAAAAKAVGQPRATLYRWEKQPEPGSRRPRRKRARTWSLGVIMAVEQLRLDYPMWGKRKLVVLLRRQNLVTSASTVGRILADLVRRGRIIPVPTLRRKPGGRRFRLMTSQRHAKRLPRGLKPTRPGALVQIDTLFVNVTPDRAIKHFTAYDPVAKWTLASVATRASAHCATALLDKLIVEAPFPIEGVQVDGGSEFMAEFEAACRERRLTLYVLPPKRPQLNGAVERAQGSWRYEFYAVHDLPSRIDKLQPMVDAFAHHFNHVRPHDALDGRTPAEYLNSLSNEAPASHMC